MATLTPSNDPMRVVVERSNPAASVLYPSKRSLSTTTVLTAPILLRQVLSNQDTPSRSVYGSGDAQPSQVPVQLSCKRVHHAFEERLNVVYFKRKVNAVDTLQRPNAALWICSETECITGRPTKPQIIVSSFWNRCCKASEASVR